MAYRQTGSLVAHDGPVKAVDVRDGVLATGGADGMVRLLAADGAELGSMKEHDDIVNGVRFGPQGLIASASKDGSVRVWDPKAGEAWIVGRHEKWAMGVSWSDDGQRLATVSEDASVRVWDAGGGEVARADLNWPANAVDWQGARIAVASGDRKLYLFTAGLEEVRAVTGGSQMLWTVRFAPEGARVAWAGRDRLVRILDGELREPREIGRHGQQVWSVTWEPDGERLVTASADRTARIWSRDGSAIQVVEAPEWVRWAGWVSDRLVLALEDGSVGLFEDDGSAASLSEDLAAPPEPAEECQHGEMRITESEKDRCEVCGATESLRLCMECGHVGCCESQLAHATHHWEATGHPHTTPTPGGEWRWCYECDRYVKRDP